MASRQRESLVYWEKQGADRMCALHCLNSVLQGPYFTEAELLAIGLELDQRERQLMAEGGTQSEDYQAFLAEGSGNVAADGYFNVSVLIECLRRKRVHCICSRDMEDLEEQGRDYGYILNHADHWLALRRVHGTCSLKSQGYTAFVVRPEVGDLPAPGAMQTRNNNQFYLTQREMDELHRKAADQAIKDAHNAQRIAGDADASSGKTFLANVPRGKEKHVWPEGGGYRLDSDSSLVEPTTKEDLTSDDPELQEAIRLSMECYKKEIAKPSEEPSADEDGVRTVFVRTPSGKRLARRFRKNDTVKEGAVVTNAPLDTLEFQAQEQLMLQL